MHPTTQCSPPCLGSPLPTPTPRELELRFQDIDWQRVVPQATGQGQLDRNWVQYTARQQGHSLPALSRSGRKMESVISEFMSLRLAWKSQSSCFCPASVGILCVYPLVASPYSEQEATGSCPPSIRRGHPVHRARTRS